MQCAFDARRVSPLLPSPSLVVLGGDLASVRVAELVENGLELFDRDVGPVSAAPFLRLHVPEIAVPRTLHIVPALPLLGTGKIDYPAAARTLSQIGNVLVT